MCVAGKGGGRGEEALDSCYGRRQTALSQYCSNHPSDHLHPVLPPPNTNNNQHSLNHQRHPPALTSLLQHITAPASRVFFPPSGRTPLPHFPQVRLGFRCVLTHKHAYLRITYIRTDTHLNAHITHVNTAHGQRPQRPGASAGGTKTRTREKGTDKRGAQQQQPAAQ